MVSSPECSRDCAVPARVPAKAVPSGVGCLNDHPQSLRTDMLLPRPEATPCACMLWAHRGCRGSIPVEQLQRAGARGPVNPCDCGLPSHSCRAAGTALDTMQTWATSGSG